jgi:tripartite-type tricarboxylate transporter receptor subunit TctC
MTPTRRLCLHGAGALLALSTLAHTPVLAQAFPSRPITIVVPYAAGAAPDTIVRMLAPKLSASLGQAVVVDNKGGASGNIGAAFVAKAPPDGHTILLATQPMLAINPHLFKNMGYDPLKELTPITTAVNVVLAISVNPAVPASNIAELIEYVRANPGTPYGTSGVGTPMHLAGLKLNRLSKLELNHVAYRGGSLVLNDLLAGTIKVGIVDFGSSKQFADTGKLRILAIGEPTRFSGAPQVPTVAETLPGFDLTSWFGFFGPANLPPALAQRWSVELRKALQDPEITARLHGMGIITRPDSPAELTRLVKADYEAFGRLVQENKVTVE